jgi:6-bladed beta-propeller
MISRLCLRVFFTTVFAVITLSCARELSNSLTQPDLIIYPAPPDTTRVQYLTSISNSTDIREKQSAFKKIVFGEQNPLSIIKPYGITENDSKLYICDTGIGGLVIIDLLKKSFEYFLPTGRGQLQLPLNCSVDERGYLFVADGNRRQIIVFDNEGNYFSEFGELSDDFKPTDVFVHMDKIYVVSVKSQRIYIYDKTSFKLLMTFPELESGDDGYLYQPTNLFVNQNGIYVSDMGDNKIKMYSEEGKFLRDISGQGNYAGQLMRPKGLAIDKQSNVFIVDAAFENVQIFNSEGNILMFFGGPYKRHGDMWLPADVTLSYSGLEYFTKYVDGKFKLKYLIFVTNQYGPDKISVYGFVGPQK